MTIASASRETELCEFRRSWPLLYSEELYRQGGSYGGQTCGCQFDGPAHDKGVCIEETNAVMAILEAEVIYPLNGISNLHKRIHAEAWDPALVEEITSVFLDRMRFLAPPQESALGPRILGSRDNLRMRTVNLMLSQFRPFVEDLVTFYQRYSLLDRPKAFAVVTASRGSIADTIACWTAYCRIRGLVNSDGVYTGRTDGVRTGVVEDRRAVAEKPIVRPRGEQLSAAVRPQGRITVISPEERQRQLQRGREQAELPSVPCGPFLEHRDLGSGGRDYYSQTMSAQHTHFEREMTLQHQSWERSHK
jgi:hypothetical protein